MEVTITQFRKDIFSLVNLAMEGEDIWVKLKGGRFKLTPEINLSDRFSRVTPMQIINPEFPDIEDPVFKAQMLAEMEAEWTKDWDRDFGLAPEDDANQDKNGSKL